MDVVQLTTHIDATAVREAVGAPDPFATRASRDRAAAQVRAMTSSSAMLLLFDGGTHEIYDISAQSVRIGRSVTADIELDDPMISRKHAVIEHDGRRARVIDDRSLNGVYVNGERVAEQALLSDGDEVQIAGFVLKLILTT